MNSLILKGDILTSRRVIKDGWLFVKDGKISRIGIGSPKKIAQAQIIDAKGCFVSPGFIDLQIYGNPKRIAEEEAKFGTTRFLATIPCDSLSGIFKRIDIILNHIKTKVGGAEILGIHLEGPYLNKSEAGAQPKRFIRKPSSVELRAIIKRAKGRLKIMTIAPEIKGAVGLIKILRRNKIVSSLGHTISTYDEARKGVDAGIRCATHIFNAMGEFHQRELGAIGAALVDERIFATVILDGAHISPHLFKLLLRCKGKDKVILITDSIRNNATFDARWDGSIFRLKNGTIAGSGLTMIGAVKNAVRYGGISILDAVALASSNPARVLGLKDKGEIKKGADADLVLFDKDFDVKLTMRKGEVIYKRCAE